MCSADNVGVFACCCCMRYDMCTMERVICPSCIGVRFVSNLCSCPFVQEFGLRPRWRNNVPCSNWSSVCVFATVLCSIGRSAASSSVYLVRCASLSARNVLRCRSCYDTTSETKKYLCQKEYLNKIIPTYRANLVVSLRMAINSCGMLSLSMIKQ